MMAKSKKLEKPNSYYHGISLRKLSSRCTKICVDARHEGSQVKASEKKEWEDALCSVCMEFPHNAVLLLCSSYDKGCRPYMCATSHRYSNCLEQYKKAYTKVTPGQSTTEDLITPEESSWPNGKGEISQLMCPLCRGLVKGWTVVEPARRYLNAKKRTCMQDNCSFVGSYKTLRKHVKLEHPLACPRAVDPSHAAKWKKLENERDLSDVFSTVRSTMPGAIVIGDYVIERYRSNTRDDLNDASFQLPAPHGRRNGPRFSFGFFEEDDESSDDEDFIGFPILQRASSCRLASSVPQTASRRARFCVARRAARLRPVR